MGVVSFDQAYAEEARWEQTSREWREFWKIGCSKLSDGPATIAKGLPQFLPGQEHPEDPSALVVEWWPRRIEATNFWDLELRYSTDVDVAGAPTSVPAVVTIDSNLREIPSLRDINGNPVINAAGQFLTDPPATYQVVDQVIMIEKNIDLRLPQYVDTHPGTVNSDGVRIRGLPKAAGTLFCASLKVGAENNIPGQEGQFSTLRSQPFTTVQIELWWRAQGWTDIYPNVGFYQVVNAAGSNKRFESTAKKGSTQRLIQARSFFNNLNKGGYTLAPIIVFGDVPPHPWPLDANGAAIQTPGPDDIIFLQYDMKNKQPFNQLPGVGRP